MVLKHYLSIKHTALSFICNSFTRRMDAIELLKKDHKKVEEIFKKIMDTTINAEKTRLELFEHLNKELTVHVHIEETIFYPVVKEVIPELTLEAYEEHTIVKNLLKDISNSSPESDSWMAKVTVLKENVEHHVKEEEGEMFPKAEKALGKDVISLLGKQMEEEKRVVK